MNIDKTLAMTFLENQGEEIHLSESIFERSNCSSFLGIFFAKHLTFPFRIAEVVEKLSKQYSVKSRSRHYVTKPVLLQYYNTFIIPVIENGLSIYDCIP